MNSFTINNKYKKNSTDYLPINESNTQNVVFLDYLWKQFLILFEQEKDKKLVNSWLTTLTLSGWYMHRKTIEITIPNKFIQQWIEQNIIEIMKKIFARLLQEENIFIEFIIVKKYIGNHDNNFSQSGATQQTISHCMFIPGASLVNNKNLHSMTSYCESLYTKDNFLITDSNKEIISALQYYIEKNTLWTSVLFIYGESGIGKTHLLFALKNLLIEKNITVLYLNAEDFLKKYIQSAKNKTIYKFERELREVNILLLDDFEYLVDKQYTQEFLLQIIKEFTENGKKIILTAKNHIAKIIGISSVLLNKLDTALVFQYKQALQNEIRNILALKIQVYHYDFPIEFLDHIINISYINIQQAENLVHKIMAQSIIAKKKISLEMILENIKDVLPITKDVLVSIDSIIDKIDAYKNRNLRDVIFKKTRESIYYRYLVIYIARKKFFIPCNIIAKFFKYKDHTTISYACKICEKNSLHDDDMKKIVNLF